MKNGDLRDLHKLLILWWPLEDSNFQPKDYESAKGRFKVGCTDCQLLTITIICYGLQPPANERRVNPVASISICFEEVRSQFGHNFLLPSLGSRNQRSPVRILAAALVTPSHLPAHANTKPQRRVAAQSKSPPSRPELCLLILFSGATAQSGHNFSTAIHRRPKSERM